MFNVFFRLKYNYFPIKGKVSSDLRETLFKRQLFVEDRFPSMGGILCSAPHHSYFNTMDTGGAFPNSRARQVMNLKQII
jgi:predicted secreted Zn-dependent protease